MWQGRSSTPGALARSRTRPPASPNTAGRCGGSDLGSAAPARRWMEAWHRWVFSLLGFRLMASPVSGPRSGGRFGAGQPAVRRAFQQGKLCGKAARAGAGAMARAEHRAEHPRADMALCAPPHGISTAVKRFYLAAYNIIKYFLCISYINAIYICLFLFVCFVYTLT